MRVSAIIPAFNEADRIGKVLEPLKKVSEVEEIIVVDDGSSDDTADVARRYGVRVIQLPQNKGKALALDAGVKVAKNELLLFLDADLVGLRPEHVKKLLDAYAEGGADIVIGIFKEGRAATDLSMKIAPFLSGQRVLHRRVWERARKVLDEETSFGAEIALTKAALKEGWKHRRVTLEGVSHVRKEEKHGFWEGFKHRLAMYRDILRTIFRRL